LENFNTIENINNTLELDDQFKITNQNSNQNSLANKILNQNYSNTLLPYGLLDTKLVQNFLLLMRKDLKIENKLEVSITLNKTNNPAVLELFLEFEGAKILTNWLSELKEKINDQNHLSLSKMQNIFDTILLNILIFCERLKISLHDLKYSKIGKMVNNFAKSYTNNKEIQQKSINLVKKWKKIVDEKKEKDKERNSISNEKEREREREKSENLLSKKKHNEINSSGNGNGSDKNNKKYIIYILFLLLNFIFIFINSMNMNREINTNFHIINMLKLS